MSGVFEGWASFDFMPHMYAESRFEGQGTISWELVSQYNMGSTGAVQTTRAHDSDRNVRVLLCRGLAAYGL